jgi:hypothetical protein
LQEFENVELNIGHDIFMETLLNNIKNEVISYQTFIRKTKHKKIDWLRKNFMELKTDYNENVVRIQSLEKELDLLIDSNLRKEIEKF